ncbi:MAG: hypothetical protein V4719_24105 [Planctomycetota bacterium]
MIPLLFLLLSIAAPVGNAGWNPLKTVKSGLSEAGSVIGAPAGGLLNAATKPSIRSAEDAGHRLIADIDTRLKQDIDLAISKADGAAKARLTQLDKSMEARIYQLTSGIDQIATNSLLEADRISAIRLSEFNTIAEQRLDQIDMTLQGAIASTDQMLEARVAQVGLVLLGAINEVDQVLENRIEQLDEIAERRIGNVDLIATKAGASIDSVVTHFEYSLFTFVKLVSVMVLVIFFIWRVYVLVQKRWGVLSVPKHFKEKLAVFTSAILPGIVVQCLVASFAICIVFLIFGAIAPSVDGRHIEERQIANLVKSNRERYEESISAFDFRRAKYYAAQLQLLSADAEGNDPALGLRLKADLMQQILTRPGCVQSPQGLTEVMQLVGQAESSLPEDPDILALQAFISWNTGSTRRSEYEAARLCMLAVDKALSNNAPPIAKKGQTSQADQRPAKAAPKFALLPLAHNYLAAYLMSPLPDNVTLKLHDEIHGSDGVPHATITALGGALQVSNSEMAKILATGELRFAELKHILDFNSAVAKLMKRVGPAYTSLVKCDAEAKYWFEKLTANIADLKVKEEKKKLVALTVPDDDAEIADIQMWNPTEKNASDLRAGWKREKVDLAVQKVREAQLRRYQQAFIIFEAFRSFDQELKESVWLNGSTAPLAAFRLNDAIYSRAVWYLGHPGAFDIAPRLTQNIDEVLVVEKVKGVLKKEMKAGPDKKPVETGKLAFEDRVAARDKLSGMIMMAPPRLAWSRRYGSFFSTNAATAVAHQEFERFRDFEVKCVEFETVAVKFWNAVGFDDKEPDNSKIAQDEGPKVSSRAAELSLYSDGGDALGQPGDGDSLVPYSKYLLEVTEGTFTVEGKAEYATTKKEETELRVLTLLVASRLGML